MSHTPYDSFSKDLALAVLSPLGKAESDVRITSDPQFADLRFVPNAKSVARHRTELFARMAKAEGLFEFAHLPPDLAEMISWQRKQIALFQTQINEARRDATPPPRLPPVLWGLSSGRPTQAMRAYAMRSMGARWPRGCYQSAPAKTFRLVVISELPRTRDTLLVRVMGAGVTLNEAMEDLRALPPDAPERTLLRVPLRQLQLQLNEDPSDEAKNTLMNYRQLAEEMDQALLNQGIEKGRQEGRQEGAAEGLRQSITLALTTRGLKLSAALRARLDAESRVEVLQRWLVRSITAARTSDVFAE